MYALPRARVRGSFAAMLVRSITTLSLVFILYFSTSGGAYTTETLVASVGPGAALLILLLVPVVYSLPEILIIGELASMLPLEGGYYRWVQRAFGPFWAFQNGWLTWMYSLVDMAIYPKLFVTYLAWFAPELPRWGIWTVGLVVIWGATAVNLAGAGRVGRSSVWAGTFIITGFLATSVAALVHASHVPWHPFSAPGSGGKGAMAVGLSIALWNYIGWDNASTVQGEVRDATRSYPRALAIALPLVVAGYIIPLLATLSATDWSTWVEGGWPRIALAAGGALGPLLAAWLALGGMVSALALFNALLLAYSRIPFVMAMDGLLPAALARTDARVSRCCSPPCATRCSCCCRSGASSSPTCCCTRSRSCSSWGRSSRCACASRSCAARSGSRSARGQWPCSRSFHSACCCSSSG